jgi:hypothetical protein
MALIEIKFEGKLLVVTVVGNTTSQELVDVIHEYYPKQEVTDVLWDFSDGSWNQIPQSGFRDIARAAKTSVAKGTRAGSKTVFVGTDGLEYGLHRMYQTMAETSGVPIKYRVFKTLEDATAWLAHDRAQ